MKQLLALLMLTSIVFTGCKRGEEDPAISFKSRDSRIEGEWDLTSYTKETSTTTENVAATGGENSSIQTSNISYTGTTLTKSGTQNLNGDITVYEPESFNYTLAVTFDKDGTYTFEETLTSKETIGTKNSESGTGAWMWSNTAKNKTGIQVSVFGASSELDVDYGIFTLKKLSKDEMIWTYSEVSYNKEEENSNDAENKSETVTTVEYIFTKK